MAKYQNDFLNPHAKKIKQEDGKPPVSPFLRGRRSCLSGASSSGSGSSSKNSMSIVPESGNGNTKSDADTEESRKERDSEVSSSSSQGRGSNSTSKLKQHFGNSEADKASGSGTSNGETKPESEASEEIEAAKHKTTMSDSSENTKINPDKTADQSGEGNSSVKVKDAGDVKQEMNGEIGEGGKKDAGQTTRDCEGVTGSSAPHENGEVVKGESKGKSPCKISSSLESTKEDKKHITLHCHTATTLYRTLLGGQDQSDSDSDDEQDESFQGDDNR